MFPEDQIAELKVLYPEIAQAQEAGTTYFLIPRLILPEGCNPSVVDALFCPTQWGGYHSRLFFEQLIASKNSRNWNASNVRIFERNWHAFSLQVKPGLRLAQTIASHLGALR